MTQEEKWPIILTLSFFFSLFPAKTAEVASKRKVLLDGFLPQICRDGARG